ncbi:GNAT family N-acetyltransferase [Sphingomonas sp.]|uniref:GNAT family N-acetyltransferase n=1 Tax=Sphingomonas sp. TaxID=28214 RepID=UPI003B00E966
MSAAAILPGTAADLDEVMRIMAIAFDPRFGEAWTRGQCSGILGLPGVWLSRARADAPAGFALARAVADEAELLLLAVDPARRRCGIGTALLAATVAEARRRGAARLLLEMREGNPAATLYAACGFVVLGRRRGYYRGADGRAIDAITLGRALGAAPQAAASIRP